MVKYRHGYGRAKSAADFAAKEKVIVTNYLEGLKILSYKYNDATLLTFIDAFENSDAYAKAFEKSVSLAELRDVPESKILKSKADIDNYFRRR